MDQLADIKKIIRIEKKRGSGPKDIFNKIINSMPLEILRRYPGIGPTIKKIIRNPKKGGALFLAGMGGEPRGRPIHKRKKRHFEPVFTNINQRRYIAHYHTRTMPGNYYGHRRQRGSALFLAGSGMERKTIQDRRIVKNTAHEYSGRGIIMPTFVSSRRG